MYGIDPAQSERVLVYALREGADDASDDLSGVAMLGRRLPQVAADALDDRCWLRRTVLLDGDLVHDLGAALDLGRGQHLRAGPDTSAHADRRGEADLVRELTEEFGMGESRAKDLLKEPLAEWREAKTSGGR